MGIRLVIADDHALFREGIRNILEQSDDVVVVGEAADGEEAVRMALDLRPDVLLMDIAMPRLNGVDATRAIRACRPATAILVVSAFDDDPNVFATLEAGAAGYLLKSVRGNELLIAIRRVHAGELVLSPSVARKVIGRFSHPPSANPSAIQDERLTDREGQVLLLLSRGSTNKAIARELNVSLATVKSHLASIFRKLRVASRTEAVTKSLGRGTLRLEDKK